MTIPGVPPSSSGVAGTVAPAAPGRLGVAVEPRAALEYLDALGRWRDDRRRELDQLDRAALQSDQKDALTHDLMLSLALWKAVSDRYELLLATWDSGRVGQTERERMSALIWGRLDGTLDQSMLAKGGAGGFVAGLAVSLPEACRLSDALAGQLRVRLALDPSGLEVAERVRELRAQLERIRDQIELEPVIHRAEGRRQLERLGSRLAEIAEKAARGGDVGGLLPPLGNDAARFERDLIVNAAKRREATARLDRARELLRDLAAREVALQKLADQCVHTVDTAPNYAVPDVQALGPLPNTPAALEVFLRRLDQVSRAMTHAQDAYTRALHDYDELVSRLAAYRAKATALGVDDDPDVRRADEMASDALARRPVRMGIAGQLVSLYQSYLQVTAKSGESP
ncbi:hypothetical protein GCM10009841_28590 [Microlunatus panaciterrae]|uniref:Uncharacterized protein n=1 Tax=Microlunatus panaciterrae TaxID=400768 RepID=A0ABS2RET4_9ACTN|nr:hypothetical protein [Microlunatus panaciterrae]MBM7797519.1 hypothetical protein [Microlunatus panaciterrae]